MTSPITKEHEEQFREEGYFILEGAIPKAHLQLLRDECAQQIARIEAEMDAAGADVLGINHRGSRYFIANKYKESARLSEFLFSPLMADVCRATLGPHAFLFHEQYVVKAAERGMSFGWHQDSGYVGHDHRPYLSCWCPLDDATEANGTISVLPYSRASTRSRTEHEKQEGSNDLVGYFGDDPGVLVECPAGSVVAFSSTLFHRSGPNTTNTMRRVYLPQYSAQPLTHKDNSKLWAFAEPFLQDGEVLATL